MANLKQVKIGVTTYNLGYSEVAVASAEGVEGSKGLMSAADKAKLDSIDKAADDAAIASAVADASNALSKAGTAETNSAAALAAAEDAADDAAQATADAASAVTTAGEAKTAADAATTAVTNLLAEDGDLALLSKNVSDQGEAINTMAEAIQNLPTTDDVDDLQDQIDALHAGQNLADMVGTKAALDALSTENLKAGDKVQVMADETQANGSTIYNYNGSAFEYVGKFGGPITYTKAEVDAAIKEAVDEVETHANKVTFTVEDEVLVIDVLGHAVAAEPEVTE